MKKYKLRKKYIIILCAIAITLLTPYFFLHSLTYGNNFSNSFYSTPLFSDSTAMIIVPHEDDEVNIAGAMIHNLVIKDCNVIVVFTTNGDYRNQGLKRIKEALNSTALLGVPSKNVIFLGYGDQGYHTRNTLYNAKPNVIVRSPIGRIKTYGEPDHLDFRSSISNKASLYTRRNYKRDMKDVILKYLPDYIFSVDYDKHPDHRSTSLIFEESLCDILKSDQNYKPIVYKGYAYDTAYYEKNDFYKLNMESTLLDKTFRLIDSPYELPTPNYNWRDRVRFPVPPDMLSYTISSNLVYAALSAHKTQNAKRHARGVANSDIVYWERRTDSLTYHAHFSVSSGNPSYLNNFKLIDSSNISRQPAIFDNCVWEPSSKDKNKSLKIIFDSPQNIGSISFYDNFVLSDNILGGTLNFSDGTQIKIGPLNKNGSCTNFEFPEKQNITTIEFSIDRFEGKHPGLCELEVYKTRDNRKPEFIKLMLANKTHTFIYKYICGNKEEIPLDVYIYPNTSKENQYRLKLIDNAHGTATLKNNMLLFKESSTPEKCKVRVELVSNPNIYDEVEFVRDNFLTDIKIKALQYYENVLESI